MRPRGLRATAIAMAFLNLGGFVGIQRTPGILAMVASFVLFGYLVIWYYWQGQNWARLLVLFISGLTVVNFLGISVLFVLDRLFSSSLLYHLVIVANAALGAFLLYWLNKKDVRAWFRKSEPDTRVLL